MSCSNHTSFHIYPVEIDGDFILFIFSVADMPSSVPDTGPTLLENLVTDVPQAPASVCSATHPFRYRIANMYVRVGGMCKV